MGNNPETLTTSRHRTKIKLKHNTENGTDEQHYPHQIKNPGLRQMLTKGKHFLLLIEQPTSYKYTYMCDKSLFADRGKEQIYVERKRFIVI